MTRLFTNGRVSRSKIGRLIFPLFFFALWPAWDKPADALPKPVAKVNGMILTEIDLEEALNEIMPAGVFHGGFSSKKRAKYRPQAFENMIEKELFFQEALKKGLKVDEEVIKTERDRTVKRFGDEKKFQAALKEAGLTDEQYQEKLKKKQLVKRLITVEVENKAQATEEEIKDYYQRNEQKFMRPEARRLTHILIHVKPEATAEERKLKRARAQEVIDKINAGGDMSALAWDYSEGPYRVKGGDMGLVHRGRLYPDLEKEVFQLEPGRLSGIIETIHGYHIVRVNEVKPPEQLSLGDVHDKIRKELTGKNEKQIREALADKLKAEARIEIY
ncbi:MAG: peptidylprolyl isomerase [Desulfobacterales bacterium]|nr:MAG: peptidylprolyl isomerase [Desulfobacterales bacterium]